jgi:peptidoglycan/xylan/chitin deacetylase (PgdA/CDA1 family)
VTDPTACWYASPAICLAPGDFEQQVRYFARHYRVLPLPEATAAIRGRRSLPPNSMCLTFDDGYADNLEAARTLRRHGLTATFYITAGCLAGEAPFWLAELRYLLPRIRQPRVALTSAGRTVEVDLRPGMNWNGPARAIGRLFKSITIDERERLRDELRRLADAGDAPSPMLTWDQVREMHGLGMTIGSHTLTHPNLPSAGLDAATNEIHGARARLEQEIGGPVTMFSYPNGGAERYVTAELQAVVREAGYEAATTSANGFATLDSNPYALERVQVAERLADLVFGLEFERFLFKPGPREASGE